MILKQSERKFVRTQHKLTLIFENTRMIEDQRLKLMSLTSHLYVRHLTHIISSLDYPRTLISFAENPFFSKLFLFLKTEAW